MKFLFNFFGLLLITHLSHSTLLFATPASIGVGDLNGISPYENWKTIVTPHFRINFPEKVTPVAQKVADYYEKAHELLKVDLAWEPHHKTQVVLIDNTDSANGNTAATLRYGMILYLSPPDHWSSIGNMDDWLWLLIVHEYTHFLNMDATRGFYQPLRTIFGDAFLPNSLWPSWMLEGLAVYMETKHTQAGRGRSPYYDMILRTAIHEKTLNQEDFFTLDRVNGPLPYFPYGETAYLFGYYLMNQAEKTKPDALKEMTYRSSKRVPYFINDNVQNITGKDWMTLWSDWVQETKIQKSSELAELSKTPETSFEWITPDKNTNILGHAISPKDANGDQWIAYQQESSDERSGLYLRNLRTGTQERLTNKISGKGLAFTPNGRYLLYSSLNRTHKYDLYSDLFAYDLKQRSVIQLTDRQRAKDPSLSVDGKRVVFSYNGLASSGLAEADLITEDQTLSLKNIRILLPAKDYAAISSPHYYGTHSQQVVYSFHENGKPSERIEILDLASETTGLTTPALARRKILVDDGHWNQNPFVTQDGSILFTSDYLSNSKIKVTNIYQLSRDFKTITRISNVLTGANMPSLNPINQQVIASVFKSDGYHLAAMPIASYDVRSVAPTGLTTDATEGTATKQITSSTTSGTPQEVINYSPFPSLLPRQWAPWLISTNSQIGVGAQLSGYDAVDRHRYVLGGIYSLYTHQPEWFAIYSNRSFGPEINLSITQFNENYFFTSQSYSEVTAFVQKRRYSVGINYSFDQTFSSWDTSLSAHLDRYLGFVSTRSQGFGAPFSSVGKQEYARHLDAGLEFNNTQKSKLAIKPEEGLQFNLDARMTDSAGTLNHIGMVRLQPYFHLGDHVVIHPYLRGALGSKVNFGDIDANIRVVGRQQTVLNPLGSDSMDQLNIRGFATDEFFTREVGLGSLDCDFPLIQIWHGWETNPIYFKQLWANLFMEGAYFPNSKTKLFSTGLGVRLTMDLLQYIPITVAFDYHLGKNFKKVTTKNDLIFSINLGGLSL